MKTITRSYGAPRQLKALPRLSREGFVPAGRPGRRRSAPADMLCPKPEDRRYIRSETAEVPAMMLYQLGPAARIALREIAATGDIMQYGDKTYIVAAISAMTMDTLSAFETELDEHELTGASSIVRRNAAMAPSRSPCRSRATPRHLMCSGSRGSRATRFW